MITRSTYGVRELAPAVDDGGNKRTLEPHAMWPHAPVHRLTETGVYMVTAATYRKQPLFHGDSVLRMLHNALLTIAANYDWRLEAWAVFPNHYHFVAAAPADAGTLTLLIRELHSRTAIALNRHDAQPKRKVWHNFWDTQLTHQVSYLARLNYVHQNAVKHGVVPVAADYPWCSASWFERTATPAQVKTIHALKTDRVRVQDDF
jgi:putative transposase